MKKQEGQGSVKITKEMLAAGDDALFNCQDELFSCCPLLTREWLLESVYRAMRSLDPEKLQ
jgi:hypothetical protein